MTTYMTNEHGAVESHNLAADTQVSAKALFAALDGIDGQGKVQLRPQRAPVDAGGTPLDRRASVRRSGSCPWRTSRLGVEAADHFASAYVAETDS
jgi:hypothetical protein